MGLTHGRSRFMTASTALTLIVARTDLSRAISEEFLVPTFLCLKWGRLHRKIVVAFFDVMTMAAMHTLEEIQNLTRLEPMNSIFLASSFNGMYLK